MVKIIWSDSALNDLTHIYNYIAKDSVLYASRTIEKIYQRTNILYSYPKSGKPLLVNEGKRYRELIEGNYRIIYIIKSASLINIVTVHHSAMNLNTKKLNS